MAAIAREKKWIPVPVFNQIMDMENGHEVEEIRIRAFNNIQSKLAHQLICEADLVQEKHLFIRLLEWFNFNDAPKQVEVLELLQKLAKHSSGAHILQEVGGIDFLSNLRADINSESQSIVDDILERLFHLTTDVQQFHNQQQCVYEQQMQMTTDSTTNKMAEINNGLLIPIESSTHQTAHPMHATKHCSPVDSKHGYFTPAQKPDTPLQAQIETNSFRFSTFPWIALTATDKHVLSSTDSSLSSSDGQMIISACHFLSDVVFQDFPAEVFLQRPSNVKSLLSSLGTTDSEATLAILTTLQDFIHCLQARISVHQDPSMYTPKLCNINGSVRTTDSSLESSDTRPSLIGGSPGGVRPSLIGANDSQSHSDRQQSSTDGSISTISDITDSDDMQMLQFSQISLPHFCTELLHNTVCILSRGVTDTAIISSVSQLLQSCTELLAECVIVDLLWNDGSNTARQMVEKLHESFDIASTVIYHNYNAAGQCSTTDRLIYLAMASFVAQIVEIIMDKKQIEASLTDDVRAVIPLLCRDYALIFSFSNLQSTLMTIYREIDPKGYNELLECQKIGQSMKNTCEAMLQYTENDELKSDISFVQLVELLEGMTLSLHYHLYTPAINVTVQLYSTLSRTSSTHKSTVYRCKTVFLQILSHKVCDIRKEAYRITCDVVKGSLCIDNNLNPLTNEWHSAVFVMDLDVFHEIALFGLSDKDSQIRQFSEEILFYLLQSQLLLPEFQWQQLTPVISAILPILQAHSSLDTRLGKCLNTLIDHNPSTPNGIPMLTRFRAALRSLYSKDSKIRAEALSKLTFFLAHELDGLSKLPQFSDLDVSNLTNIFVIESPLDTMKQEQAKSVFMDDALVKVYNIYSSSTAEHDVRLTAAQQIAIMMEDKTLHKVFRNNDGLEKTVELFTAMLVKHDDANVNTTMVMLIPSLLAILYHLIANDRELRHELAQENYIYYAVFRGILVHKDNSTAVKHGASLLMLLLFDETAPATISSVDLGFSLPKFLVFKYNIPFTVHTHESCSAHALPLNELCDPTHNEDLHDMLRLQWNETWYSGIQQLLAASMANKLIDSGKLQLSTKDKHILHTSYIPHLLNVCIIDIENATSHNTVIDMVKRLRLVLIVHARMDDHKELLTNTNWKQVLARFFQVIPSSSADELLLVEVLELMYHIVKYTHSSISTTTTWLSGLMLTTHGAIYATVKNMSTTSNDATDAAARIKRQLNRTVFKVIQTIVGKSPFAKSHSTTNELCHGDLVECFVNQLKLSDSTPFYNLAALESTLLCLSHITARSGWSLSCTTLDSVSLCEDMLKCLLEIVTAFHIGRGQITTSYMGCGVTEYAAMCLQHLAYEMSAQIHGTDWIDSWLMSKPGDVVDSGFQWLTPMWTYRSTEVRILGLGIAVSLTSTHAGHIVMTTHCQHLSAGLWAAIFAIMLDQSECSLVRCKAVEVLVNLTSEPFQTKKSANDDVWQGPMLYNDETKVTIVGLSALSTLLHHSRFYSELCSLLKNYYPQPAIHPVSVTNGTALSTPISSRDTITTADSAISEQNQVVNTQNSSLPQTNSTEPSPLTDTTHNRENSTPMQSTNDDTLTEPNYPSVATPCLVSAVCRLLTNLITLSPDDTIQTLQSYNVIETLISMLNVNLLEAYVKELQHHTTKHESYTLTFYDLLKLHTDVLTVLQFCITYDKTIATPILSNTTSMRHIILLLTVTQQENPTGMHVCELVWQSVFNFLLTLLHVGGPTAISLVTPHFTKHWQKLSGRCIHSLQETTPDHDLWFSVHEFLALLLNGETRRLTQSTVDNTELTIANRLDHLAKSDNTHLDVTVGSLLCQSLLKSYDLVSLKPTEQAYEMKALVMSAFKGLLAISTSAKYTAYEAGLCETICEQLKHLTVKLNFDALEGIKPIKPAKQKEHPVVMELIITLELLRNLMHHCNDVKIAVCDGGFAQSVHRLWAWCQIDNTLMCTILSVLATYTAHCTQACSSLTLTSALGMDDLQAVQNPGGRSAYSSNSLLNCIIKLCQRQVTASNPQILKSAFGVIATCVMSQECRGVLWKSNFIHDFSQLNPKKSKKSRIQKIVESLWLDVIVNLSFSTEGQNMILKVNDVINLLLDFGQIDNEQSKYKTVLILRNLCFHTANKPKMLSNDNVLPFLLECIEDKNSSNKTVASSALLALVYNCQKAKVSMKTTFVMSRLRDIHKCLMSENEQGPAPQLEKCKQNIQDVLTTIKT